ncbi:DUF6191 domain-containing protein [Actinomadura sp. NPDC047616]|uniref:DUF6191 domain-containing protein n=1 Tax=Actinomadura sp. NPDC047616 TaxID=3155914 RepID=UPI0033D18B3A
MKSPFRRRRGRLKGRAADRAQAKARPKPEQHEVVDWPTDGTGKKSLMGAIRGDGQTGAGFGGAMFEDLATVFEGSKRVKVEEQEQQKLRRHDDRLQAGGGRDDLSTGKIRIRRAGTGPDGGDEPANGSANGSAAQSESDGATSS